MQSTFFERTVLIRGNGELKFEKWDLEQDTGHKTIKYVHT